MTTRQPLLLLATLALLPSCGHKGNPLPPLRHTPPPLTEFRLAQRGDALELQASAPRASVAGVAYDTASVEFLHTTGLADIEKAGARQALRVAPGTRATLTLPLPAPGTLVRAAARGLSGGERGPRSLTKALVAQPPVEAPRELSATLGEGGIELAWKGERPKEIPPPVGPKPPGPPTAGATRAAAPGLSTAVPKPETAATPETQRTEAPPLPATAKPPGSTPDSAGRAQAGEAKAGEAQTGEAKAGEAKTGEARTGAAQTGEAKAGEAKPVVAPRRRNGFFVYRRPRSGSYGAPLGEEPLDRRTFPDESAPLGATWCYVVRAVASSDPLIESAPSNEACLERRDLTPPATPAGLALLPRQGGIELLWSPSAEEDLAGYRVYRAAEGAPPEKLAEVAVGKTSYLDETARQGVVYRYALAAFDQSGNESPPSDSVEATLP